MCRADLWCVIAWCGLGLSPVLCCLQCVVLPTSFRGPFCPSCLVACSGRMTGQRTLPPILFCHVPIVNFTNPPMCCDPRPQSASTPILDSSSRSFPWNWTSLLPSTSCPRTSCWLPSSVATWESDSMKLRMPKIARRCGSWKISTWRFACGH